MARKKSGGGGGEGANWMDTYGDLVTLLLTFFVLLFSMSSIDAVKWAELQGAFSGMGVLSAQDNVFQVQMQPPLSIEQATAQVIEQPDTLQQTENASAVASAEFDLSNPEELEKLQQMLNAASEEYNRLVANIETETDGNNLAAEIYMDPSNYSIVLRFSDNVFFDSSKAELKPPAQEQLDIVRKILAANQSLFSVIRIEGHTDNVPISTKEFPSNMELSTARATVVYHYLMDPKGKQLEDSEIIDPVKVIASGYGEWHPVADNGTSEGRTQNRRVDFVIEGFRETHFIDDASPINPQQILESAVGE